MTRLHRLAWIALVTLAIWSLAPAALVAAEAPDGQLRSGGFDPPTVPGGDLPRGWGRFAHVGEYRVAIDPTGGPAGDPCLTVEGTATGDSGRAGVTQRVTFTNAPRALQVRAQTRGSGGRRAIMVQFFRGDDTQTILSASSDSITGDDAAWREVVADFPVPPELRGQPMSIVLLLYLYGTGTCAWDGLELRPLDRIPVRLEDRASHPLLIQPHPADGAVVGQNPPDLRWRPETATAYAVELCQDEAFAGPTLQRHDGVPWNCFNPPQTLATGTWFWRYRAVNEDGDTSPWSQTRSFVVPPNAVSFLLPPEPVIGRVVTDHPRLYVRRDGLDAFRQRRLGVSRDWWAAFEPGLQRRLAAEPAAEPVDSDLTKLQRPIDLEYFKVDAVLRRDSGQVVDGLWTLAFAYLVTGEAAYAEGARRYLLHVSRWDPEGATSFASNDQVFREIAIKSAMAYDWIYEALTPDERATVAAAIQARGRVLFARYNGPQQRILNFPYDSHGQSNIGYLGLVALAVAHEVPEAAEWLEYVVRVYANSFPPWGGDDGGWSQGVTYWKWSCFFAFQFAEALRSAAAIDLFEKPWFRNNGWFKIFFHPPWCTYSHFGDSGTGGVDISDARNLACYAARYGTPEFRWFADRIPGPLDTSPYGYFLYDLPAASRPPLGMVPARHSADIGWVAMHSRLYRPDDVMLFAKASPYGSYSHCHADQNSFVIYAFGEPLAIDSGYYPWYGSAHHVQYAQQTKAHNTILVGGEGQPIQDLHAGGQSLAYHGGTAFSYWLGDATAAYAGRLQRFHRHILHVPPEHFLIIDDLAAPAPQRFQWLLHSMDQPEIRGDDRAVILRKGAARLAVQHLMPAELTQTQTDDFGVPPENRGTYRRQWHYTAETVASAPTARWATLLRASQGPAEPALTPALAEPGTDAVGVKARLDNSSLAVAVATDPAAETTAAGLTFVGRAAACDLDEAATDPRAGLQRYLLVQGRSLRRGTLTLVEAAGAVSVSLGRTGSGLRADLSAAQDTALELLLPSAPGVVETAVPWSYDAASGRLRLRLSAGTIAVVIRAAAAPSRPPAVSLALGEAPPRTTWEHAESVHLDTVVWGDVAATPGVYRLQRTGPGRVWFDRQEAADGDEVLLSATNHLLVAWPAAAAADAALHLALTPLYSAADAVDQAFVEEADPRLASATLIEAESYTEALRGQLQVYSHRAFLSGGKGVSTPAVIGVGARWQIEVPADGRYLLALKVSTHEPEAVRALRLDGRSLLADDRPIRIPTTGGFGATPEEWRHVIVSTAPGQPVEFVLTAGRHTLDLISVSGPLNLDALRLIPR